MIYTIEEIRDRVAPIAARYHVHSLSLFGSYARGEATEDSDIDIIVDAEAIRTAFQMGGFYADLSEALNKELDLITSDSRNDMFMRIIQKDALPLYRGLPLNTPPIQTDRFFLRRAYPSDISQLFKIYSDPEVMRFVPVFPARDLEDMEAIYLAKWAPCYDDPLGYQYVIALKDMDELIGYVHIDIMDESHDLGYGVRRDWWHKGVASEAAKALLERAKVDGVAYVTATHDRENPRSGMVMRRVGMAYQYSYHEHWMPKHIDVVFRMYQINLDGNADRVYRGYQERFPDWMTEDI